MREQVVRNIAGVGPWAALLGVVAPARVARGERCRHARRDLEVDLRRDVEAARPPAVGARPVEPEIGDDRLAVVAVDPQPWPNVRILAHRGTASRAGVAVRRAQPADGSTKVERPRIQESRVCVGIERPLFR